MDWIKITDKEPVLDVAIIAFDADKGVVPCVCRNNGYGKKCYWLWNDDVLNLLKITHWMPLPHAPELKYQHISAAEMAAGEEEKIKKTSTLSEHVKKLMVAAPGQRVSTRVPHPYAGKKISVAGLPARIAPEIVLLVDYGRADKTLLHNYSNGVPMHPWIKIEI
jgi:hypothetical protein